MLQFLPFSQSGESLCMDKSLLPPCFLEADDMQEVKHESSGTENTSKYIYTLAE